MAERSLVTPEFRDRVRARAVPIAVALGRLGLTPDALTVIGFVGTCAAALAAGLGQWAIAGLLVIAFGIFDLFDGALARATGRTSAFGAFLDSTLDRTGENLVLAGVAFGSANAGYPGLVLLAGLAMATSSIVTYTRARAEAVGLHGEVGIAPRPERLVLLAAGLVLTGLLGIFEPWLALALGLITVLSAVTVVQRIVHVRDQSTHH
jgi:CDP-diacylglycerol--glycerol-3-phosphate 3-phosphatidyltransferase